MNYSQLNDSYIWEPLLFIIRNEGLSPISTSSLRPVFGKYCSLLFAILLSLLLTERNTKNILQTIIFSPKEENEKIITIFYFIIE